MISSAVCCNKHHGFVLFCCLWKIYSYLFTPDCTRNHVITYTYPKVLISSVLNFFSLCIIIVIIIPVLFVIVNVIVVLTLFDTIIVIVVVVVVFFVIVIIISVTPLILLSFFLFLFWYCQGFRITALKMRNLFLCRAQFLGRAILSTPPPRLTVTVWPEGLWGCLCRQLKQDSKWKSAIAYDYDKTYFPWLHVDLKFVGPLGI